MKAKRISNPFRKGNQAARKMQVRFFLSLMVLLAPPKSFSILENP